MRRTIQMALCISLPLCGAVPGRCQRQPAGTMPVLGQLAESGHVEFEGRLTPYVIHRLPVSSFPQLPDQVAAVLTKRGCMIPQTYEAHRPENVIHGGFEQAGSSDWAALCATQGTVSLLVFFGSVPGKPMVLASAPETERLQPHNPSGALGFNWGIDRATPGEVHDAQAGMDQRPPPPSHDALADSVIEHRTIYHFYTQGKWTLLAMPDE